MGTVRAVAIAVAVLAMGAAAQEQTVHQTAPIIGVALESSDGRIQNWSPELLEQAAAMVERSAKNARVIILAGRGRDVADAATKRGVDYLMTIEIAPRPNATVSFGAPPQVIEQQQDTMGGHPRAEAQGSIFLAWTVQALNGKGFKLHDSRTVQGGEYPLAPHLDWLHDIASRSVRDAAAAATGKLKKKAGI